MTDGAQSPDGFSHWLSWLIHVDPLFKGVYRYNGVLYGCMAPLEQIQEKGWDEEAVQQRLEECLGALWYIVMQSMQGWHIDTAEESQSCLPVMSSQDKPSETSGSNTSREMSSTSSWQHPSCITSMPHPSLWFPGSSVHPVGTAGKICHDLSRSVVAQVCPLIHRAMKERSADMKRKGAQIVGAMVLLIKDL